MKEYRDALADQAFVRTPAVIRVLFKMVTALNKQFTGNTIPRGSVRHLLDKIRQAADLLGLDLFSFMQDFVPADVTALAEQRDVARKTKNWAESDRLRKLILEQGYVVEDTSTGPRLLAQGEQLNFMAENNPSYKREQGSRSHEFIYGRRPVWEVLRAEKTPRAPDLDGSRNDGRRHRRDC